MMKMGMIGRLMLAPAMAIAGSLLPAIARADDSPAARATVGTSMPLPADSSITIHLIVEKDGSISQCTVDSFAGTPTMSPAGICNDTSRFDHPYTDSQGNPIRMNLFISMTIKLVPLS